MSKTKRQRYDVSDISPATKAMFRMKYKDLQIACIVRGMTPQKVVDADHHRLASFFEKNFELGENPNLLIEFDAWREEQLKLLGYKEGDVLMRPALRLSYVGDIDKMDRPTLKVHTVENPTPKKPKTEVDENTGVRKGTKKALTYELAIAGKKLDKIIEAVMKKFPDAQEKSIKIWVKRALKPKE